MSPTSTRDDRLERIFAALAVFFAACILITTINIAREGWVPVPVADDWDRWYNFFHDHYTWWYFWQQHVDHRILVPKLFFAVDHLVFSGRGWFLLVCTFCVQALTLVMLLRLSRRAYPQDQLELWILGSAVAACLFSGQQFFNFIMPFQVQFPLVYCAAIGAFFALWKAERQGWPMRWVSITILVAAISTYSMANGVLLWLPLLLAAFWLRMPRRPMTILAAAAILLGPTYLYHFHRAIVPVHFPAATRPQRILTFFLAQLGAPMYTLGTSWGSENLRLAVAIIPGILMAAVLLAVFVLVWRRRNHFNHARAMLVFYSLFLASTSFLIAFGRSEDSPFDAFTSKYLTPPYLLWASMLLVAWPFLRRVPRPALYGVLCAAILFPVLRYQPAALEGARLYSRGAHLSKVAIVDNVGDPEGWFWLFHTAQNSAETAENLKANHLSLFTEEWTHWPGIPLLRRFSIDRSPGACQGSFETAVIVPATFKPGWRVSGWAWDNKAGRSPLYIVLGDESGVVTGVAIPGFPLPPSLQGLPARYVASTWNGYVSGEARPVTAYVLEADNRSLCPIGTLKLRFSGKNVAFEELGPLLPVSIPQITNNAFAPNGYYQPAGGPGPPPVDGPVYGSFPDGNTGTLRIGPIHLDGHTEIAIPVVTGPDQSTSSMLVRDAATQEVLIQMSPPQRTNWWAWRPDIAFDHEMNIEIIIEDKGTTWGQWIAVGWPHALKPR